MNSQNDGISNQVLWFSFLAIAFFSTDNIWRFFDFFDRYSELVIRRYIDVMWDYSYSDWPDAVQKTGMYLWIAVECVLAVLKLSWPGVLMLATYKLFRLAAPEAEQDKVAWGMCLWHPFLQVWKLVLMLAVAYIFFGY